MHHIHISHWNGPGVSQEALVVWNASNNGWISCGIYRKQAADYLNHTKPHQTTSTASEPSEPLSQVPPSLVAYENVKWEKNCLGKGNESEMN
jgi:hypothetical protein